MTAKVHLDRAHGLALLRDMMRIREFEAACAEQYQAQNIRGFLHLYDGEEAVSVGVMQALAPEDAVVATYREHGQAIARGIPMRPLMAEMFGRLSGCCRGRGGSMHVFDRTTRFYGGNAIVGGGLPLAVGVALADRMQGRANVTACFFGEGAADEGAFHESLNLASLWHLPVLFVCENNGYSMGTPVEVAEADTEIWHKAAGYRMHGERVDGMDVVAVEVAARRAAERIRAGEGPVLLECATYRFRAHSMFDAQLYRDKAEIEQWRERGPILRFRAWLEQAGLLHEGEAATMEAEIRAEVADAVAFAEAAPLEEMADLDRFVTMDEVPA
ncbi:pyruvate dehydrogenase (acetyl-transferring) E1 component subunit alpha [Roseomonas sp. HF4]|uniref:pyruvate dehydrogenase (acetyl-transferring) E1 component subunit alpha n=1 Tax=Roseomonas sp. HF4 TaxID=2562313 RepID=UPI0010BFE3AA|nr:pyruvate dehydrogenase (acetyl-transferring) E1 component subunit alpha [Roseomonas sp. HF4]